MVGRYFAGASHLPFFPLRSYLGSEMPQVNEQIKMVRSPYGEDVVAVVPPLNPDVAIIHAQRADRQGNTHIWGLVGVQKEVAFAAWQYHSLRYNAQLALCQSTAGRNAPT